MDPTWGWPYLSPQPKAPFRNQCTSWGAPCGLLPPRKSIPDTHGEARGQRTCGCLGLARPREPQQWEPRWCTRFSWVLLSLEI